MFVMCMGNTLVFREYLNLRLQYFESCIANKFVSVFLTITFQNKVTGLIYFLEILQYDL